MTYVEGFVTPVPTANRDAYIAHAEEASAMILEFGATRFVEAWGEDVPRGKVTDFYRAVEARDDETVLFSWFEYPDKTARDAANARMMADPRMESMATSMPFDGSRMIYGGFDSIVDEGTSGGRFIDGIIVAVPADKKDAYRTGADRMAPVFLEHGALRSFEAWGGDVSHGKITDYYRATKAEEGEVVVYSWIEWSDRAARDAGWAKVMADERMKPEGDQPFDGKRMFWGGFAVILDR